MENSYYQIAQQVLKDERSKHYDVFLQTSDEGQEKFNNEKFIDVFRILKNKHQIIYKLFGDLNFKILAYEYFLYNPVQSSTQDKYGKNFSEFLGSLEQLEELNYIKWLAKLDWFWFNERNHNDSIALPKGTLSSWGNIHKDEHFISIAVDESIIENVVIKKAGKEIALVVE